MKVNIKRSELLNVVVLHSEMCKIHVNIKRSELLNVVVLHSEMCKIHVIDILQIICYQHLFSLTDKLHLMSNLNNHVIISDTSPTVTK
ncbi:hypothetical protein KSF78_0002108 [Schistosoma japonicum]|nr:hypothetical protein KSF78_0002108 [Schistosoma japonicum]